MKKIYSDVVIIGAGLTGLALAYYLRDSGLKINIVEARDRIGGRILTKYDDYHAPIELGATWFGKKHETLVKLLEELDLKSFKQLLGSTAFYEPMSINPPQIVQLPANQDASYRIGQGSSHLINALAGKINKETIHLNQAVVSIQQEEQIIVKSTNCAFSAKFVVSTLPPFLFNNSIEVTPKLPIDFQSIAKRTHTWMGESIKVGLTYEKPFWRENNWSGTIFSNVGPIPEMYDHSDFDDNHYALKGFFNGRYHSISREARLEMVLAQLSKYYGSVVNDYISYEEKVWTIEKYTYQQYEEHVLPHQYNGHAIYQKAYLDGKLWIGGTETASKHPGYMDGAIVSAQFLSNQVRRFFNH